MTTNRLVISMVFCSALAAIGLFTETAVEASHLIEGKQIFDHVMVARYQRAISDGTWGLECDVAPKFAKIEPGGHISFDIGHRRHFTTGEGPDLTVRTAGGVRYTVAVAGIGRASDMNLATAVVGQSSNSELEVDMPESPDMQYVRIFNAGDEVLHVDCVWAHHVIDHPLSHHDHDPH